MSDERWLTAQDVADRLGIRRAEVYRSTRLQAAARSLDLDGVTTRPRKRWLPADLEALFPPSAPATCEAGNAPDAPEAAPAPARRPGRPRRVAQVPAPVPGTDERRTTR